MNKVKNINLLCAQLVLTLQSFHILQSVIHSRCGIFSSDFGCDFEWKRCGVKWRVRIVSELCCVVLSALNCVMPHFPLPIGPWGGVCGIISCQLWKWKIYPLNRTANNLHPEILFAALVSQPVRRHGTSWRICDGWLLMMEKIKVGIFLMKFFLYHFSSRIKIALNSRLHSSACPKSIHKVIMCLLSISPAEKQSDFISFSDKIRKNWRNEK